MLFYNQFSHNLSAHPPPSSIPLCHFNYFNFLSALFFLYYYFNVFLSLKIWFYFRFIPFLLIHFLMSWNPCLLSIQCCQQKMRLHRRLWSIYSVFDLTWFGSWNCKLSLFCQIIWFTSRCLIRSMIRSMIIEAWLEALLEAWWEAWLDAWLEAWLESW